MSKEDITGKSGKVKITIQYTNKEEHTVKIEGRNTVLYTPFIVGCGTIFNNDNNKNIETSDIGRAVKLSKLAIFLFTVTIILFIIILYVIL